MFEEVLWASHGVAWGSFGELWGAFRGPWGSFWGALGGLWGSFGSLLGVPGGLWGVPRRSCRFLGASGAVPGIFREIPGALLAPFWHHFSMIFRIFCSLGFCIDFLWLLGGFLVDFRCIFGGHFGYFSRLCEKCCTPRTYCKYQSDRGSGACQSKQKSIQK